MTCSMLRCAAGRLAALGLGLAALPGCGELLGVESDPALVGYDCIGTLRVRITTDDSGTATDIAPPYNHGIYDYLRHLNDAEGGLRGCPIDVEMKDAGYDPSQTAAVIDAWRARPEWPEISTLFVFGTGPTTAIAQSVMADKKIIIPGSYAGSLATPVAVEREVPYPEINSEGESFETTARKTSPGYPYLFFPATDYSTAIRIGLLEAWKLAPGRVAMAHEVEEKCLYCVDPLAAGKSYVGQLPDMLLGEDMIVPQTSSEDDAQLIIDAVRAYFDREIEKKQADPRYVPVNWVWSGNSVLSSSLIGKGVAEAQRRIDETFADQEGRWAVRVMANNWGIGETTPDICGSACNEIFYGLFPVPRYGDATRSVGMNELMEIHDEYRRKDGHPITEYRDVRYVQGYTAALMWRKAVERALDAGHNTPTGEDLKNALESFQQVGLDDMTAGPITFSAADHRPQSNEAIYKLNGQGSLEFVEPRSIRLEPGWLGY